MSTRENTTKQEGRDAATRKIAVHVLQNGLSKTSLRQLAAAADISDRMLLYYFRDKNEVLSIVLQTMAADMAAALEKAMPAGVRLPVQKLFARTAELASGPELRPYLHLAIEMSAGAVRCVEPFTSVSRTIADGYITWMEARLDEPDPARRRAKATMILGMLDGLAILSVVASEDDFQAALQTMAISMTGSEDTAAGEQQDNGEAQGI